MIEVRKSTKIACVAAALLSPGLNPPEARGETSKDRAKESKLIAHDAHVLGKGVLTLCRSARSKHDVFTLSEQISPNEREISIVKEIPGSEPGDTFTYRIAAIMKRSKSGKLLPNTTSTVGGDVYVQYGKSEDSQIVQSFGIYNLAETIPDRNVVGWSAESSHYADDGTKFTAEADSANNPFAPNVSFDLRQLNIVTHDIDAAINIVAGTPSGE